MVILYWFGWLVCMVYVMLIIEMLIGSRQILFLRDLPATRASWPQVSIVVAARNEEERIEEALSSLLRLDYPQLELIVVDDRSEDGTTDLLQQLSAQHPSLHVERVNELPTDWLGKNHALWRGSQKANGDLLLFTDADVVMECSALKRAVGYLETQHLDHLAVTPEARMPGWLLSAFGLTFGFFFFLFVRPWRARNMSSRAHVGIGAFNLVRRDVYHQAGGHQPLALRPDDDLKLGKLIKQSGYRQDLLIGSGLIQVEWYDSLGSLARGLEKNLYSGTDYRTWLVIMGAAAHAVGSVFPFTALLFLPFFSALPWTLLALILACVLALAAWSQHMSPFLALLFPVSAALFVFLLIRTLTLNLAQGGIWWRGTFYPLEKLKANRL